MRSCTSHSMQTCLRRGSTLSQPRRSTSTRASGTIWATCTTSPSSCSPQGRPRTSSRCDCLERLLDDLTAHNGLKGQIFLNVGYGVDATLRGKPHYTFDGVRKVSQSPFQALEQFWLWLNMNSHATDLGGDCFGDSGSPKFFDGNTELIVATVTSGDAVCRATSKDYRLDTSTARTFLGQFVTLP